MPDLKTVTRAVSAEVQKQTHSALGLHSEAIHAHLSNVLALQRSLQRQTHAQLWSSVLGSMASQEATRCRLCVAQTKQPQPQQPQQHHCSPRIPRK
jgi:hypothetical protein